MPTTAKMLDISLLPPRCTARGAGFLSVYSFPQPDETAKFLKTVDGLSFF